MQNKYKEFLASERGESIYDIDVRIKNFNGKLFEFIETPSHGFLIVPASSIYYNLAKKIRSADHYGYIMPGIAVFLEEDCQAGAFISKLPAA
jgi:hypothetical protein